MSVRVTGRPASMRCRIQSKPFSLGLRAAQPGAPITGLSPDMADEQQIAGIDRHCRNDRSARQPP